MTFNGWINSPFNNKSLIENALGLLKEKEEILKDYNNKEKQVDLKTKEKDDFEKEVKNADEIFIEIKEEYIEKINKYNQNNIYFKIDKERLEKIIDTIFNYSTDDYFDNVRKIYNDALNEQLNEVRLKVRLKDNLVTEKQNEINDKNNEIEEWKAKKDPEPVRKQEVIDNRIKLNELNIPYVPLYKAIDFNDGVDEKTKASVEESFLEMGLLDALVIPEKYKESVFQIDGNVCDKYIFADPNYLSYELSQIMHTDKNYGELSSNLDDVLKSVLVDEAKNSTFISNDGIYGLGILRGKITGNYKPKFIGVTARKQFREEKLIELAAELNNLINEKNELQAEMNSLLNKQETIIVEGDNFPSENELNHSKNILIEAKQKLSKSVEELAQANRQLEEAKKEVIVIKEKCYHACEKIFIEPKNHDTFSDAIKTANEYSFNLKDLISEHTLYLNFNNNLKDKNDDKLDVEFDISELIGEINTIEQSIKELSYNIENINKTLKSSDIANIQNEINQCIKKLDELPKIIVDCSNKITALNTSINHINEDLIKLDNKKQEIDQRLQWSISLFKSELKLGYVYEYHDEENMINIAKKLIVSLEEAKNFKKNSKDTENELQQIYYLERNILAEYKLSLEIINDRCFINAKYLGKALNFYELKKQIEENIETQSQIIKDKDREMFEDILANNLSKKIRAKIFHSKKWVNDMNELMESLDTSSGLTFSLKWIGKKAESEEELSSEELVRFLERDSRLMKQEDIEKFTKHFKSKIERARTIMFDKGETKSFHATIKEILDYRNWFEFQLYYTKTNERKRELTNNAFFTFSGGEKAMAMYVPLFSAVNARYQGARKDCPRIICLDEAFAGVDSKNIRDMFRLLEQLDLSFIINSQVLWGDYDTVPKLSVIEIIRPNNSNTVSLIRYKWNGKYREMVV
ncbi:MAG: SbcC/MukB-like Walker B domain-containing protein [Vulcanibacillus sp.]